MDILRQDLGFAVRSLRRHPAFALGVVMTLAVGVAAATAMLAVADGILLRPLPVRAQNRVVVMWAEQRTLAQPHVPLQLAEYLEFARASRALSSIAAIEYHGATRWTARDGADAISVQASIVSGPLFRTLGVAPSIGRALEPEDDIEGARPVLVISHALWQRRYGGDPRVIGRSMRGIQTGRDYAIVGVMPRGFEYPRGAEVWVPAATFYPAGMSSQVDVVGRLAPGATPAQAREELDIFLHREGTPLPADYRAGLAAVAKTLPTVVVGDVRPAVWILAAAVTLLLLIACANAASLLLVRGTARHAELAVRAAIGAGRGRLVRQLMTEHLVLALLAGALGAVAALWAVSALRAATPIELPRVDEIRLDARVLAGALLITLATAVIFGLFPALVGARGDLAAALRDGTRVAGATGRAARARQSLIVAQIAITVVVLAGAGLLVRSLAKLQVVDMGFAAERLVVAPITLPSPKIRGLEHLRAMLLDIEHRVSAIPGVEAASLTTVTPFAEEGWSAVVAAEPSAGASRDANPFVSMEVVGPGYFAALGLPLRGGRALAETDRDGSEQVTVVSETVARQLWPDGDAVGRRLKLGLPTDSAPFITVVGVVGDTRHRGLLAPRPSIYLPFGQFPAGPANLLVRTRSDLAMLLPALRRALAEVDPDVTIANATPMTRLLDAPLARPRFVTSLLAAFAAIALALSAVGVYGLMAAFVRQRTHEIGVRIALGATGADVRRLVLGRGLRLTVIGIAVGLAAALAATRVMRALLFEVSPSDHVTLGAVAMLLMLVAAAACWLPVRAATRVDPATVLRAVE